MQSDNDIKLALDLGECVKEFEKRYKTLKIFGESAENNLLDLRVDKEEKDELKQINIQLLDIEYSFEEFINKLKVINDIYCEVGNVIYKQKSYAKLKIIKVESGSLLSMILGDKNIIESIAILFNKTVNLVFNKYTYEGKIYRHREFREELLSDAEAIQELKKLGYDVEKAQENNQEALTMLTKDLLSVANSSSKIKIDEKEYNINAEIKQKFLESGNILKLSSAENED